MARTDERGGPQTRARIAGVAAELFLERGYDAVTVAEVARSAGVSSVTVFKHFPRKEDLFLDRSAEAHELLRAAVRDRAPEIDVLTALRALAFDLAATGHPLSGVDGRSVPFFRTVAASPALIARSREIAADLEHVLAEELEDDPAGAADATLLAAFFVAGYVTVLVQTARQRLAAADATEAVVADHRARLERLFEALRRGVDG